MLVDRISHSQFIEDLSGYGAWKKSGRWRKQITLSCRLQLILQKQQILLLHR